MIFFDARFIRPANQDGISRFSQELLRELSKLHKITAITCSSDQEQHIPSDVNIFRANRPTNPFLELALGSKLNRAGAKVVFSPMQTMGSLGRKFRLILTLHDLIYYRHPKPPDWLSWPVRVAWRIYHLSFWPVRRLLNRADYVVTVSQTTKQLIEKHRLTKRPVAVIPNASDLPIEPSDRHSRSFPSNRRLLYMGSFMGYKNVELLISAMAQLPNFELLLLSKIDPKRESQLRSAVIPAGGKVTFLGGVSDQRYIELLKESFALVSASKDEGFGIPVVEAMSVGLPVVVSDIEIFREVAGDCALYFDPEVPNSLASQLRNLDQAPLWEQLSSSGTERSKSYSWAISAKRLSEVISGLNSPEDPVSS